MLVGERRTSRERWIWILILALSPLAGLGGILMEIDRARRDGVYFELSREQAIERARSLALQQGLAVHDWSGYSSARVNDQLNFYYRDVQTDVVQRIRELAPETIIQVSLISPEGDSIFKTDLSTDGRLLGFSRPRPGADAEVAIVVDSDSPPPAPEETEGEVDLQVAESQAREAFERRFGKVDFLEFKGPDRDIEEGEVLRSVDYSWFGTIAEHPELR